MSFLSWLGRKLGWAVKNKAEEEVDRAVDKAVDKAVDEAVDKVVTKELQKEGVTVESNGVSTENSSYKEVQQAQEANGGNINVTINVNGNAGAAAGSYGAGLAAMNEIMSYLILDSNNNVIGVKDDAPEYIKNAYNNGEFNDQD